jgi:GPH family glycoside/pentoside/hexuronide:cation symporter
VSNLRGDRRLDLRTKLFYGLGTVAYGVKENGFSYLLLLFYNQVVGLPASRVGLALMIALVFDAIIDPLIGQLSDNLRTPWGRRHPLMYAAALPLAIAYAAIWNPPHWGRAAQFAFLVVMAVTIRALTSLYEVPSSALAAEFSTGYDERSVLLSYRYFFAWVGGLGIQLLAFAVLLVPDATHKVGQLNPAGYAHYGLVASAVMFVVIVISTAGTHRQIPNLTPAPPRRTLTLRDIAGEMGETLSNRSFIFLMISSIASFMGAGLTAALNGYFNTYFWGFSARQISVLTAGVFLSAILALVTAPALSRAIGKRTSAMLLSVAAVAIAIAPLLLRMVGLMPANGTTALLTIMLVVSISGITCNIVATTMGASMIADVVEAAELKTGRRSEGLFFAASAFVNKSVSGFGILAASAIIEAVHLKPGMTPASVPTDVLRHLALVYAPTVAALCALAVALLFGYRITRAAHAETLRRLAILPDETG